MKMADFRVGDKKIEQLKVAELRDLLEQRGLPKAGVKSELVKRLSEAMSKEENVETGDQEEDALRVHELSTQDLPSSSGVDAMEESNEEDFAGREPLDMEDQEDEFSSSKETDLKMDSFSGPSKEDEEKGDYLSLEVETKPKPFAREGTPLQDEKAEDLKRGQDDAEMKDSDAVIDLHVRDAFEMNEDVASREGDQKRSAGASRDSRSHEGGSATSSRRHLWVSGIGGSLNKSITAIDLQDFFSQRGTAMSARIVAPKSRYHPPKRYGFVTMKTEEEAETCVKELNMRDLKGQKLTVEIAKNPPPSSGGGNAEDDQGGEKTSGEGSSGSGGGGGRAKDGGKNDKGDNSFNGGGGGGGGAGKGNNSEHSRGKGDPAASGGDTSRTSPDRERGKGSPRRRSQEFRGDRRRRGRSRSPRRRSPMRRHSPRGRSPAKNDLRRVVRNADDSGPYDGRSRGLLPDPIPSSRGGGGGGGGASNTMNRFEGRLEPRADIIVRTTEELFQRELGIQRHEKQLAEQMKLLRDREMKDKIASIEQERRARDRDRKVMERERDLMDRERKDRVLREELERELKHKAMKEKEMIERERKSLEHIEKDLREKESRWKAEMEARTRELDAKERDLNEKERVFQHQKATFDLSTFQAPGTKRQLPPSHASEYESKRPPVSNQLSPYNLPVSRVSSSSSSTLLNSPHSWNTGSVGGPRSSTSTSYQTPQSSYSAEKKNLGGASYESESTSHSYSSPTSYSHGRPTPSKQLPDNQSPSYGQYSTPKTSGGRGGGLLSGKPSGTPGSGDGGWRDTPTRSTPSGGGGGPNRGYGQQDRPTSGYGSQDRPSSNYSQQGQQRMSGGGGGGGGGYGQQDRTPSSYNQQDRSGSSGYRPSERTSAGYGSQDRTGSSYGQQDRTPSSYSQPDRSSSGYGPQDRSSGGGPSPSHSHMSDHGGPNRSLYPVRGRGRGRGRGGMPPPSAPTQRYDMYSTGRY